VDDFRVKTSWATSRKRRHVESKLGASGVVAVIDLWAYCARERTSGDLSGLTDVAIAAEAGWQGDVTDFIAALTAPDFELLDGAPGARRLHDWKDHQPWIAGHEARCVAASKAGKASAAARAVRRPTKGNGSQRPVDESLEAVNETSTPFLSFPSLSLPKEKRRSRGAVVGVLPPELQDDRFKAAWATWQQHRREIKKALTPTTAARQLKTLAAWGVDRAIAAIEHTIEKGWTGLREPDNGAARGNGNSEQRAPAVDPTLARFRELADRATPAQRVAAWRAAGLDGKPRENVPAAAIAAVAAQLEAALGARGNA